MTFYVASPNFDVLSVIINFLLAKNHRENILKRTIIQPQLHSCPSLFVDRAHHSAHVHDHAHLVIGSVERETDQAVIAHAQAAGEAVAMSVEEALVSVGVQVAKFVSTSVTSHMKSDGRI